MNLLRWVPLALCATLLLVAPDARGQQQSGGNIDIQQFRPSMDSKGYITLNASQILGHLEPSFGLVTSWARRPLVFNDSAGHFYDVNNLVTPQLQAAIGRYRRQGS